MFEVGDMVVCVDDTPIPGARWTDGKPEKNGIYTVVAVVTFESPQLGAIPALHLDTLNRSNGWPYAAFRFRKIRKPSIKIFRQIVASVKGDQHVNA